ncbi:type I polyketide synthase [Streptomyces rubellomurinus]|uniref:type I polyketide synthase n=1 Tax=Streptomyces rubellomurinus (strain ATCC 31215) TaxID=359131 RepID=UPI0005F0E2B7|nr:type I polyketide synthase [Streptomyces rubellomurinus]
MTEVSEISEDHHRIAVVGMAGRFPGAGDVETLWQNLVEGREGISALTEDELLASGADPRLLGHPDYVRAKGVLADADRFDAAFFGYSPREAELLDPQHRVFLECAWQALESAGCDPQTFRGRIGVFAGSSLNSYLLFNVMASPGTVESAGGYQVQLASDKDFLATRAAYKLGLTGAAITVQSACSTSLTAVHLACQSLLNGECDIALAGGVSVSVPLQNGYLYEPGGILSPDGHCRAFDAEAGGTVAGNGVGVVVLRRLADARERGDLVDAVILGSAVNNDGSHKAGYSAPGVDGQAEVIAEALAVAEVDASDIGYVETHGTGTVLGDPIEIAALTRAFREHTEETGYCAIGSVKSNVGHLDAAAGVTALIKAVLALRHEAIPATLHHRRPNPALALESSPFFVNTELRPWPRQRRPRRAGVSSFGIGGTNAHVVLQEGPPAEPGGPDRPVRLLALSAKSAPALVENARRLADHLERHPQDGLGDTAFTLALRRRAFEHRATVVAEDRAGAVAALRRIAAPTAAATAGHRPPVVFLFPGQGAQYVGMARDLYRHEPLYAAELDRCAELFAPHLGEDLRAVLFPPPGAERGAAERLERTAHTQPVLFAVEYALARLWRARGVEPRAMAGHSIGEYVAACLAGVFSLPDAVRLVAARGRLVQSMPAGAMLAVFLPEAETAALLTGGLSVAAVNSTALSVVSGGVEAIEELERRLKAAGTGCRRLHTSHAFHSPSMAAAVAPFVAEVRTATLNPPTIPFCSNVTGTWITDEQAASPEYWGRHLREPVRFGAALDELLADPAAVLLEVGPGHALTTFAREHAAWDASRTALASLRHPNERRDDRAFLLESLGRLWSAGVAVDWSRLFEGEERRLLRLPGYAFERHRYWIEPDPRPEREEPAAVRAESADALCYTPGWRRLPPFAAATAPAPERVWVLLGAELGLGRALAQRLTDGGARVVRVVAGPQAQAHGPDDRALDPLRREHHAELLRSLAADRPTAVHVLHLWSLGGDGGDGSTGPLDERRLAEARRRGFDSLLALAQGIGDARPDVPDVPVAVDVLCQGVHSVTGEEELRPENALLLGLTTVLPQELADATCRSLDLSGVDPEYPAERTLDDIHSLLERAVDEPELALRGRHWWVRAFDPVPLEPSAPPTVQTPARVRDGGVYLITGGLGGVGLALAEHLARTAKGPVLALLSRSELPAEADWARWLETHGEQDATSGRIRRLTRLRELGAEPLVLSADVTDVAQLTRAVEELRTRYGAIHGVVHAAGVPSRGMIAGKSRQDVDEVLAAKTLGTLALDHVLGQVLGGDEPDFVLLCSSLTSLLGGPGQSDYGAANAFLDAYAQAKRQSGAPVTAVAWDTWRGVGMAAGLAARLGGQGAADGEPTGHPLLRLVRAEEGSWTYLTTLGTEHWILDDHRMMGNGLVPGTTYLELVNAAVARQAGGRVVELQDVLFPLPVIVPDGQTRQLHTTVELRDGRGRFSVRSRVGDAWLEHAVGTVALHERDASPTVHDLAQVLRDCRATEVIETPEEIKRRFKLDQVEQGGRLEFAFGPRWQCLRRIEAGQGRLLVTLELDEGFAADLDDYALHPALLDVAGASARIHAEDVFYLPFTYRSLRVHGRLTRTVHCTVELKKTQDGAGETLTCDTRILDPEGRLLVEITDFTIKRINDVDGLLAQIDRAAAPPRPAPGPSGGALARLGEGMTEQEAVAAFARILGADALPGQLAVCARDLAAMRRLARSLTPALLARELDGLAPLGATHPRPDLSTPYVAPATEQEQAVAAVWQEVLGVDRVGVHDDFFALGGHSLAAVQIGTKIRGRFGTELDLRDFFEGPTVANTVALLAAGGDRSDDEGIRALDRDEPADLLDELTDDEVEAQLRALLAADGEGEGDPA